MQRNKRRAGESGNVFLMVIIGIVLFAALMFTLSRGMNESPTNVSTRQAKLAGADTLSYAQKLERAVSRLRSNGCSENEISFEHAPFDGSDTAYVNPNAPADFSCHIFHTSGGHVSAQPPAAGANDGSDWVYTGRLKVANLEDNAVPELLVILPNVRIETCRVINGSANIGFPDTPPRDASNANYAGFTYKGAFENGDEIGGDVDAFTTACFEGGTSPASGTYHFYHTLIAR